MEPTLTLPFLNGRHSKISDASPANRALYKYWHKLHKKYLEGSMGRASVPGDLHSLTSIWQQKGYPFLKEELALEDGGYTALRTKVLAAVSAKQPMDIYTIAKRAKVPVYTASSLLDLLIIEGIITAENDNPFEPITTYLLKPKPLPSLSRHSKRNLANS